LTWLDLFSVKLLTDSDISEVDQDKLYSIYEKWPEYFKDAADISCQLDHEPDFYESVILCGMGGSATSCDILNDLIHSFSLIPSTVIRGQNLPFAVNKRSLVIVNSVSGNTREAISNMEEATERNAEVVCISSGGELKDKAIDKGHKHIKIPNLSLPRASLPYLIMPGLKLINPLLKKSLEQETSFIHNNLSKIFNDISITVPYESNVAKKIATFLESGFAFCFASPFLLSVGTRFKNSLNENAKVHCLKDSILEASHNEIVPFTFGNHNYSPHKVLLLRWQQDLSLVNERFNKVKMFFRDRTASV